MVKIKEIFKSIQGEGPYVGYEQVFVRFCSCNLKCNYCDTKFSDGLTDYNAKDLAKKINSYKNVHSVSLTGGEPLLQSNFLKEFLPFVNKKIYLETNGTLADKFLEIKSLIDIVAADIKLESSSGLKDTIKFHDKFFEACKGVETFAKIVFNNNITSEEIENCLFLGKKYGIELILQPEMNKENMTVSSKFSENILDKFLDKYQNVRLIPQIHKFLNIR